MARSRSARVAVACVVLAVLTEGVALALEWHLKPRGGAAEWAVYNIATTAVGALIVGRLPRHPVGWILTMFGLFGAVSTDLLGAYGAHAEASGWPAAAAAQWLAVAAWCPGALMWVLALLYVPTGQLPSRRWVAAVYGAIIGTLAYVVGWLTSTAATIPDSSLTNPFRVSGFPSHQLVAFGGSALGLAAVGALASVILRIRGADPVLRQQLKWVGAGAALLVMFLPVGLAWWSSSPVVRAAAPVVVLAMVASLGAAVLRYRLFDVDLLVLRGAAFLVSAVVGLAIYAAVVITLGTVAGRGRSWEVAAATLVAVICFRPLGRAAQRALERRFDRDSEALRHIDQYLDGLRAGTARADHVEEVLRDATGIAQLRLLLRLPGSELLSDVHGQPRSPDPDLPHVALEPEALVQYPAPADPARAARIERLLVRSRLALQVARLGVGLNRQVDELDASRRRIAVAADHERRRIQRDLHDGAQQRLVTVGLALRSLERHLRGRAQKSEADVVDSVVADLGETIAELRNLVSDLPLPQLDAGLAAAFQELASRSPLTVRVEVDAGRWDSALEATAYFVGSECLTNTLKHARASNVTLRALRHDGSLLVSVTDDGVGGAAPGEGSGLVGLNDRVAAVGGRLWIDSGTGGTTVTAELPCA